MSLTSEKRHAITPSLPEGHDATTKVMDHLPVSLPSLCPFSVTLDRIAVLPDPDERQTASGLYLPETMQRDQFRTRTGLVLAIGPGKRTTFDGRLVPVEVGVGTRVLFLSHGGATVFHQGSEYRILAENEILGTYR